MWPWLDEAIDHREDATRRRGKTVFHCLKGNSS
jgi:hypothetical protein